MTKIFCVRRVSPELALEMLLVALRDEYFNFFNVAYGLLNIRNHSEIEQQGMATYVRFVYARIDGYLAGFTVCAIDPILEIVRTTDMFVARKYRMKGVARKLYERSKSEIRESTANIVALARWPHTVTMLPTYTPGALEFWKKMNIEVYARCRNVIELSENMCNVCERVAPVENRCTHCMLRTYCNPACMRQTLSGCPFSCASLVRRIN